MKRLALALATCLVVATGSIVLIVHGPLSGLGVTGAVHASAGKTAVLSGEGFGCKGVSCGTRSCVFEGRAYRPGARLSVYDRSARLWNVSMCDGFNGRWVKVYSVLSASNPGAHSPLGANAG